MTQAELWLETLTCPSCIAKIEGAIRGLTGVKEVTVRFNASKVKVVFDEGLLTIEGIQESIERLGYPVKRVKVRV